MIRLVGVQGRRLSQTIMTQTFLRYARAAGLTERKRVTPHTLRHVFASELLRAGANLRQIQELLGHKPLDSTQRYTRVNAHELRGAAGSETGRLEIDHQRVLVALRAADVAALRHHAEQGEHIENARQRRHLLQLFTAIAVTGADRDLLEVIEHVELCGQLAR